MRGFHSFIHSFIEHLKGRGYKESTIKPYNKSLRLFEDYLYEQGKRSPVEVTENDFQSFAIYLKTAPCKNKKLLSIATVNIRLRHLKQFFTWLYRTGEILTNSGSALSYTTTEVRKEKRIFTQDEISRFLSVVDDMQYRTLFELMYATGIRLNEAVSLDINDIDLVKRMLCVREGKGGKDRIVPFHKTAALLLQTHLKHRLTLRHAKRTEALFLSVCGRITTVTARKAFKEYLKKANLENKGLTPHSIRHSCATHLLENGADIRYVQELLGHESIETTAQYTHLAAEHLRKAYKTHHPRENGLFKEIDSEYEKSLDELISFIQKRQNRRYLT